MSRVPAALGLALVLAACQPTGLTVVKKSSPKPAESATVASASAAPASAAPSTAATPAAAASPAWASAVKLDPPAGAASVLSGVLKMDPSYIVAAGAGNIVAAGAGNIVAAGAGNIVAMGGGNLAVGGRIVAAGAGNIVAAGAGNIVAQGAGNIISGNASAIVAAGAGNIVSSRSGNIVAAGAGNIISGNAGAIVAQGAGNIISGNGSAALANGGKARKLLAEAGSEPVLGAGMLISVISLRTHNYLSLGTYKDAEGKPQPVYSVYTNADGAYKLFLPPGEADNGNVMVVASVPGQVEDDRLIYNVVTDAKPHDEPIDEDVALAGRYLHFAFSGRLEEVVTADSKGVDRVVELLAVGKAFPPEFNTLFGTFLHKVNDEAATYDVQHWKDDQDIRALCRHVAEVALSHVDREARNLTENLPHYKGPTDRPALRVMADALKVAREGTVAKLKAEPGYFDTHTFILQDNCNVNHPVKFEVKKSTDVGDELVERYLTTNISNGFFNTGLVFKDMGIPRYDAANNVDYQDLIEATAYTTLREIVKVMLTQEDVFGSIKEFCTRPGFKPVLDPARKPIVPEPCPVKTSV